MSSKTHNALIISIKQKRPSLYFSQDRRRYIAINGGDGGSWTRVLWWHHDDILHACSIFIVFRHPGEPMDRLRSDYFSWNLADGPEIRIHVPGYCWRPVPLVPVRDRTSPSSGECVLFVRSYFFDWCFTRQTVILDVHSAISTSSRIRNIPSFQKDRLISCV